MGKRNKAYRMAMAKKAGLSKGPKKAKKPCAKKPAMVAQSINVIVVSHKAAVGN
jgi:hypothetical protein